jgi:hypothetical protein
LTEEKIPAESGRNPFFTTINFFISKQSPHQYSTNLNLFSVLISKYARKDNPMEEHSKTGVVVESASAGFAVAIAAIEAGLEPTGWRCQQNQMKS